MTTDGAGSRKGKKTDSAAERKPSQAKRVPIPLIGAAWLIPGLGHWLLGKKRRALIFAAVIVCSFVTGILLDGEVGTPRPQSPFSWLAAFACLGNGVLYFGRLLWLNGFSELFSAFPYGLEGGGSPSAAGFAYGNTFLYTAGLMNLLTVLDVSDIARGDKE